MASGVAISGRDGHQRNQTVLVPASRNHGGFVLTGPDLMRGGKRPKGWRLKRDPYLLETNVPGVFAAGDVRQGAVRRIASAVGEGAVVVSFVHQYLKTV